MEDKNIFHGLNIYRVFFSHDIVINRELKITIKRYLVFFVQQKETKILRFRRSVTMVWRKVVMKSYLRICWWTHRSRFHYYLQCCYYYCDFGIFEVIWWCSEASLSDALSVHTRLLPLVQFLCLPARQRHSTRKSGMKFGVEKKAKHQLKLVDISGWFTFWCNHTFSIGISRLFWEWKFKQSSKLYSTWLYFDFKSN